MFNSLSSLEFGEYLKTLRKKLKITQSTITEKTGINPDTIRRIESGQVIPRYDTLSILSTIYKVDLVRKFTDYQSETTLMSLYSKLDHLLLNHDLKGVQALKNDLAHLCVNDHIAPNLIHKNELEQFKAYLEVLEIHMSDGPYTSNYAIDCIQNAIQLTVPKFSVNTFDRLTYNAFEVRLLLLYAVLWNKCDCFKISNDILFFILDYINFLFSDALTTARYLIKVHFNISYNFQRLDVYEKALEHANLGIEIGHGQLIYNDLYSLYYRKFTAELMLQQPGYMHSLRKCIRLMDLLGNKNLMNQYIQITQAVYGIDLKSDPLLADIMESAECI